MNMKRKSIYSSMFLTALPVVALAQEKQKPNVIFLFSDQHQAACMGYEGHPDVITPNFDRLAHDGVAYERAYSQDAISAPSRMSLFSGLYPRTLGYLTNEDIFMGESCVGEHVVSLQKSFQLNGYDTYAFGKRHLWHTIDEGWTLHRSHLPNESPDDNYVKWVDEQGCAREFGEDWAAEFGRFPGGNSVGGTPYPKAPMGTRVTRLKENQTMEAYSAQNTIEVIRNHKDSDKPFFCFTSFYRPHQPYTPLPRYLSMYNISDWGKGTKAGDCIKKPATLNQPEEELPEPLRIQRDFHFPNIWCLADAAEDEQLYRFYIGSYYALVSEIDHWVGEIIKELEKNDMLDNTIIVYAADHGDFVGAHGMIEKTAMGHNVYEETLRVPLIFYWKDHVLSGYHNDELVGLIDIYPTLVEMAGLELPKMKYPLQGISLYDNLTSGKPVGREYTVSENWSQATVITKDYKLGYWRDCEDIMGKWADHRDFGHMLFDCHADKNEIHNLIDDPQYEAVIETLGGYLKEFDSTVCNRGMKEVTKRKIEKRKEELKNKNRK